MSAFLYSLPNSDLGAIPSRIEVIALGLFPVVERGFHAMRTRDGLRVVAHGTTPEAEMRVDRARQTWRAWENAPGVEFGFATDNPPQATDLLRTVQQWETKPVLMGDGGHWDVPCLVGAGKAIGLPLVMAHDAGGWSPVVAERYRRTERLLGRLFTQFLGTVGVQLPDDFVPLSRSEQAALISDALSLVYRVAEPEVSALGLLTDESMSEAMRAIVGAEALVDGLAEIARHLSELEGSAPKERLVADEMSGPEELE